MMYKLILSRTAQKFIKKLDKQSQKRIAQALLELSENPYEASNVKKLTGYDLFRKRVGDFRIIFEIQDDKLVIIVLDIDQRKDVYKKY